MFFTFIFWGNFWGSFGAIGCPKHNPLKKSLGQILPTAAPTLPQNLPQTLDMIFHPWEEILSAPPALFCDNLSPFFQHTDNVFRIFRSPVFQLSPTFCHPGKCRLWESGFDSGPDSLFKDFTIPVEVS